MAKKWRLTPVYVQISSLKLKRHQARRRFSIVRSVEHSTLIKDGTQSILIPDMFANTAVKVGSPQRRSLEWKSIPLQILCSRKSLSTSWRFHVPLSWEWTSWTPSPSPYTQDRRLWPSPVLKVTLYRLLQRPRGSTLLENTNKLLKNRRLKKNLRSVKTQDHSLLQLLTSSRIQLKPYWIRLPCLHPWTSSLHRRSRPPPWPNWSGNETIRHF